MTVEIALMLIQAVAKAAPGAIEAIRKLFSKKEITEADWQEAFADAKQTYDEKMAET